MGAVQKLATVVIVGLVALATLLVVYLANEDNRREAEAEEQEEVAVERAIDIYITNCLSCHGPAGEGLSEPGAQGTGRIGFPLGGQTQLGKTQTELNQTEDPATWAERRQTLWMALHYGRGAMPAWGRGGGGQLNDDQIDELILMIHTVDWDRVYNAAVETAGGYPTPPPPPPDAAGAQPAAAEGTPAPEGGGAPAGGGGEAAGGEAVTVTSVDIAYEPAEVSIPADTATTFNLPNEGALPHNFSIDALSVSVDIPPGEAQTTEITAAAGEYEYYCNVTGHKEAGMDGTLTAE